MTIYLLRSTRHTSYFILYWSKWPGCGYVYVYSNYSSTGGNAVDQ